ncbi:MAG: enoyl-CoA hydratase [Acidobacteria bacterium]|nr:MAG: enoyl-CoA hydratase [Acidobacteriota bacterium]
MSTEVSPLSRISLAVEPPVARITLNNAPLNVIDLAMMEELGSALADIEAEPKISTVVLRGDGDCFSAGVDVVAHAPGKVTAMLQKFHAVIRALVASRKVTVAAVHGNCLGGGAELAMMCDIVITTADATWGFPEISLGCFPPIAAAALGALIGHKRAADLMLTGATMLGTEAAEIGLATRAVTADNMDAAIGQALEHLQKQSPVALAIAKKAIYSWDSIHFDKGLARAEKIYLEELMKTEDAREGVRAFLEKRSPRWQGR